MNVGGETHGLWTLADALTVVRTLQPQLHARWWHVALGGGVLNRGSSAKDLDLYFLPFNGATTEAILPFLVEQWGEAKPLSGGDYPPDALFPVRCKFFIQDGKRIDVFIAPHAKAVEP